MAPIRGSAGILAIGVTFLLLLPSFASAQTSSSTPLPLNIYLQQQVMENLQAYLVLPNIAGKPLAGIPVVNALATDWAAGGFFGAINPYTETRYDTDPATIDRVTGKPTAAEGSGLIFLGGRAVQIGVWYYEQGGGNSPVYFASDGNNAWFVRRGVGMIAGSSISLSDIAAGVRDMLVFQLFYDADGRYVLIVYGFSFRGTFAAALMFHKEIWPNLFAYGDSWYIIHWQDNGNGNVDPPGVDTYTVIASGP